MKKNIIAILFCFVFSLIAVSGAHSDTEAGRVLAVKKKVYVIRNENRENAEPKMRLLMKDTVETDIKSRTKLFFTDDSILNLGELSSVEVEEYIYDSEQDKSKSIYKLMSGYLKVVVGRSDLEIHTPTAVVAARGTKFIVQVEGQCEPPQTTCAALRTNVIVLSGKVHTWNAVKGASAGVVPVSKGESTTVSMDSAPESAAPSNPGTMEQFADNTIVIEEMELDSADLPALVEPETPSAPPPEPPEPPEPPIDPPILPPPTTPVTLNLNIPPATAFAPVTVNMNFP